jgi:hypothetical protein
MLRARIVIATVAVLIATSGCAPSLAEIRQGAPARTGRVASAEYQVISGCVAEALQTGESSLWTIKVGNLQYQTVTRPEEKRAVLTGAMPGPYGQHTPVLDLTFKQDASDVVVEARWGGVAAGHGSRYDEAVWHAVGKCGRLISVTPPRT